MARLEPDGTAVRLHLGREEVDVIASLAEGLARRLEGAADVHGWAPGRDDAVIDRLAPTATRGDEELDEELRPLFRHDLLASRATRLSRLVAELRDARDPDGPPGHGAHGEHGDEEDHRGGVLLTLDVDAATMMVDAINDLRLALAATIGFEEGMREALSEDDPRLDAVRLMDGLAWLQGGLIDHLTVG